MTFRIHLQISKQPATRRAILWSTGTLLLIALVGCASESQTSSPVLTFDAASQKFAPCPDSPNCVSTHDSDAEHAIEPYTYSGSATDAKAKLVEVLSAMQRSSFQKSEDNYIHVEFRSRIFRFVDDVEIFIDDAAKQIHFRAAARLGYSDMGVNRKRMEEIRQKFAE